jgi:hypothetical protein
MERVGIGTLPGDRVNMAQSQSGHIPVGAVMESRKDFEGYFHGGSSIFNKYYKVSTSSGQKPLVASE